MTTYDFDSGHVPAHQHPKGGGWVAESAKVDDAATVGEDATVGEYATVGKDATVGKCATVGEYATVGECVTETPDKNSLIIPHIDAAILRAFDAGGKLDMDSYHTCDTTHCRAGWAITLAGEAGKTLEKLVGSWTAGARIYRASRPKLPVPNFFATDESAMEDLRRHAAADPITI